MDGGRTRASERLDVRIGQAKHHPRPVAGTAASVHPMYPSGGIPGVAKSAGQMLLKVNDVIDTFDLADQDRTDPDVDDQHPTDLAPENQL